MDTIKKKLLLIWPPIAFSLGLPLGIGVLAAHLKDHSIHDVKVFDANGAYLKRNLIYRLKKSYCDFISKTYPKFQDFKHENMKKSPDRQSESRSQHFERNLGFKLHRKIIELFDRLFSHVLDKKNYQIPWSLMVIKKNIFGNKSKVDYKVFANFLNDVLKDEDFDLIGFSVIYREQLFFSLLMAEIIKKKFHQKAKIVLGGAQVAKQGKDLRNDPDIFNIVDFFVEGDGEEPLLKLLEAIPENATSDVPNIFFRDAQANRYRKGEKVFRWDVRDLLPPRFEGFDLEFYNKSAPLVASQGCVWSKCKFCRYATMQEHPCSIASSEGVFEIMAQLKNHYGFLHYHFVDNALPARFLNDFSNILVRNKYAAKWSCQAVMEQAFSDRSFCDKLKSSGMTSILFGLETISPRILSLMNKPHRHMAEAEMAKIFRVLWQAGITVGVHVMFGFPTETLEEASRTLTFLKENNDIRAVSVQAFCFEVDTPMFQNPEKFGITRIHEENREVYGKFGYWFDRFGYRYDVVSGMSQVEAKEFSWRSIKILRRSGKYSAVPYCFFNTFPDPM